MNDHDDHQDYLESDRKAAKFERKMAKAKDRSKFKKTDQKKYLSSIEKDKEAKLSKQDWLEGHVLSIMPQGIIVGWKNEKIKCVLKGLLKKERTQAKNLVAVGDIVLFEKTGDEEGIIAHVKPRRTFLSRADNLSRRKEQLIAVNVDQVIITVSVVNPPLKFPIIDRYIIATQKGNMEPIIAINKIDLLDEFDPNDDAIEMEKAVYEEALLAYRAIGISVIPVSTKKGIGLDKLKQAMQNKTTVFSGQSGVGKSSLINCVTGLNIRVGEVVERTKKGSHTTTTTQLIPLEFGGWCVDTPGIKSFGVWDLKLNEVEGYFAEIHEYGLRCKFTNCTHTHEEDCAVREALEHNNISPYRYESYQALIQSISEEHLRR